MNVRSTDPGRAAGWLTFILVAWLGLALAWGLGPAAAGQAPEAGAHLAEFEGLRLHYLDQGSGGQALVLIHGWSCDRTFWRHQIPALARRGRVLALDLPGHGQSDKPRLDYTQDFLADSVKAVLEAARVERAVLVGHSMGYSVSRRLLLHHPGLVKALVNVDGAYNRAPRDPAERDKWLKENQAFAQIFQGPDYQRVVGEFIDSMIQPDTPAALVREIKTRMLATPQYVGTSAMTHFIEPGLWTEEVADVPVLAVYAAHPELWPDNEEFLRKLYPRLEYHLWTGVSHFLMLERPDRFNKLLLDFLARLD